MALPRQLLRRLQPSERPLSRGYSQALPDLLVHGNFKNNYKLHVIICYLVNIEEESLMCHEFEEVLRMLCK